MADWSWLLGGLDALEFYLKFKIYQSLDNYLKKVLIMKTADSANDRENKIQLLQTILANPCQPSGSNRCENRKW